MATMDVDALFIDTNILVYANVIETPFHEQALSAVNATIQAGRTIWISRQVIRESIKKWGAFSKIMLLFCTPPNCQHAEIQDTSVQSHVVIHH